MKIKPSTIIFPAMFGLVTLTLWFKDAKYAWYQTLIFVIFLICYSIYKAIFEEGC